MAIFFSSSISYRWQAIIKENIKAITVSSKIYCTSICHNYHTCSKNVHTEHIQHSLWTELKDKYVNFYPDKGLFQKKGKLRNNNPIFTIPKSILGLIEIIAKVYQLCSTTFALVSTMVNSINTISIPDHLTVHQRSWMCVRWNILLHCFSFNLICNMKTFRKKMLWPFDLTTGVKGVRA